MNGYYIQKQNPTVKIPLKPKDNLILFNLNIVELVLPKCKEVYCDNNLLKELILPDGCEYVDCSNNQLTELIVPNSVKQFYCYKNKLTKIIIPKSCKFISCWNNKLHTIIVDLFESNDPIKIELANTLQLANNL
jgi:Leucine-rich repeat (LRR) protein